ncbi:epoxide hydrolase, putative [Macrophomina phaseolina MS6]|uniref:Epoxide hydrolase, putative n=1 Tax=Macrophomina phaseolina (strain MS6) TaxID=1126212 RepID=K2QVB9_MACPH|nr:epoxide hydrolase, putative [Macrophomina phaseolina MS6]
MYQADFFLAHVFIDVGFAGPGALPTLANIEKINNSTMQEFGYPTMGYWYFYQEDDASEILDSHAEAVLSMFYTSTPAIWKQLFSPVGAFKSWLLSKEPAAVPTYITSEEKLVYARIRKAGGGFRNILKSYLAQLNNVNDADERSEFSIKILVSLPTKSTSVANRFPNPTPSALNNRK